jgi:hypothetical protein
MKVKAEVEFQHLPPQGDPLWREGYHFNGYDAERKIGFSMSVGIWPVPGFKEEIVALYGEEPLLFADKRGLDKEDLTMGSIKLHPLEPLKKWKIQINSSFQKTKNGTPLNICEEAELDLWFASDVLPYTYSTERGNRYEQPGFLKGKIRIGEKFMEFNGRGIRDHSWETRNIKNWGEWYGLMTYLQSGEALTFALFDHGDRVLCSGWLKTDNYYDIHDIQIDPVFSGDILRECHIIVKTSKKRLELTSHLISFVELFKKGEQESGKVVEALVQLGENQGYGFMWYGR